MNDPSEFTLIGDVCEKPLRGEMIDKGWPRGDDVPEFFDVLRKLPWWVRPFDRRFMKRVDHADAVEHCKSVAARVEESLKIIEKRKCFSMIELNE